MKLAVRLTPNSSADRVEGPDTDAAGRRYLKVRVRAVPEDGKANKALCTVIAKALGLPKSAVSLASGATSRLKTLDIDAAPDSPAAAQIEDWMRHDREPD